MRFPLVCATVVAGPLSLFFLAAPVAAQNGLPPGGPRPAAAPAQAGTSVAVIDIAYIFKNHVRFNGQMTDMKTDIERFDAQMRDESQKLAKKAEAMQTYAPTSAEFKRADEELAHLKSDFQIRVQAKKREFLELEAKVYYGIYREVEESVAIFAQRNGIGLVLRYTSDEMKADDRASVLQGVNKPVVFQHQLDITSHILNQLNAGATMPPANRGSVQPPNGTVGGPIPPGAPTAQRPTGPVVPGAPNRTR